MHSTTGRGIDCQCLDSDVLANKESASTRSAISVPQECGLIRTEFSVGTRCKLRAFAPAFRPPPVVVLPKSRVVFLAFGSFFLPFFERDFRLKKRSKCPSWRSRRFAARAVKAAQFAFTGAERTALTGEAGREAHSHGRKGKRSGMFVRARWRIVDFKKRYLAR